MQVKGLPCKEEATSEQEPEKHCYLLWAKAQLKWTEAKYKKTVLRSDELKFKILLRKRTLLI